MYMSFHEHYDLTCIAAISAHSHHSDGYELTPPFNQTY